MPATDGDETRYDVIILDVLMPDADGRHVLERVMGMRPGQVVVVLSCLGGVVRAGRLVLDTARLEADSGGGPVPLTRLEFLLLKELALHAGQPVSKPALLAAVWRYGSGPGSNVVDVCVARLRSKLGFDLIKTVRGAGYQLTGKAPGTTPKSVLG